MSKIIDVVPNMIRIKYSKVDKVYYMLVTERKRIVKEKIRLEKKVIIRLVRK